MKALALLIFVFVIIIIAVSVLFWYAESLLNTRNKPEQKSIKFKTTLPSGQVSEKFENDKWGMY